MTWGSAHGCFLLAVCELRQTKLCELVAGARSLCLSLTLGRSPVLCLFLLMPCGRRTAYPIWLLWQVRSIPTLSHTNMHVRARVCVCVCVRARENGYIELIRDFIGRESKFCSNICQVIKPKRADVV